MSKLGENIIGFDFQGWPIYKLTYREILEQLKFEHKDGRYQISDDDKLLDEFPLCLEDDGMGYGVNEKYVIEVNSNGNIFIERALSNEELEKQKVKYFLNDYQYHEKKCHITEYLRQISEWIRVRMIR